MEKRTVSLDDINRQERLLMDLEDNYSDKMKEFERRGDDLYDKYVLLARVVDQEIDKMIMTLKRFSLSYDEGADFFRETELLLEDSDRAYHHQTDLLLEEEEVYKRNYRKERDKLEDELFKLRRDYYESTDR